MTAAPLLDVDEVTFSYAIGPPAVDELSLAVEERQRLAVLGGNGSGKSTLLMLLNASLKPRSGEIRLAGSPVGYDRKARNAHRRRVGLVLQDPDDQLFSASVYEDVSFGPLNLGLAEETARQRVARVLDDLGLNDLAERPAHLLSYGQRKRVAIAGVAAMEPDVVLLDEPLSGLDPTSRSDVLDTLDRLEAAGSTIVITTHDVDLALAWADRVALMAAGKVVANGPALKVLADEATLTSVRLDAPSVLGLGEALRAAGLLDAACQPRSVAELRSLIEAAPPRGAAHP